MQQDSVTAESRACSDNSRFIASVSDRPLRSQHDQQAMDRWRHRVVKQLNTGPSPESARQVGISKIRS